MVEYRNAVAATIAVVVGALVLLSVDSPFYLHMVVVTGLVALQAATLNLIYGYAGQISLGHVAFYGVGAYVAAIAATDHGVSPWLTLLLAPLATFVLGGLIAIPAFRTSGIYFAIVTLAVGVIAHIVMVNWVDVTRGAQGLPGIPPLPTLDLFGLEVDLSDDANPALLVWALVVVCLVATQVLLRSRVGDSWIAIRENERLARSLGIPAHGMKVLAQALAAGGVGFTGAVFAHYLGIVSPASFTGMESLMVLVVLVVGGSGRLLGPVVGALVLTALPEWLRFAEDLRLVIFGVVLLAIVLLIPDGLMGAITRAGGLAGRGAGSLRRGGRTHGAGPGTASAASTSGAPAPPPEHATR